MLHDLQNAHGIAIENPVVPPQQLGVAGINVDKSAADDAEIAEHFRNANDIESHSNAGFQWTVIKELKNFTFVTANNK